MRSNVKAYECPPIASEEGARAPFSISNASYSHRIRRPFSSFSFLTDTSDIGFAMEAEALSDGKTPAMLKSIDGIRTSGFYRVNEVLVSTD